MFSKLEDWVVFGNIGEKDVEGILVEFGVVVVVTTMAPDEVDVGTVVFSDNNPSVLFSLVGVGNNELEDFTVVSGNILETVDSVELD